MHLFVSACFGEFPKTGPLSQCEQAYAKAFEPETIAVDSTTLTEVWRQQMTWPLRAGAACGSRRFHVFNRALLLLLDPTRSSDLLELWNLRAFGYQVIPVPIRWAEGLGPLINRLVEDGIARGEDLEGTSPVALHWTDRLTKDDATAAWRAFKTTRLRAIALMHGPPRLWEEATRLPSPTERVQLELDTESIELNVEQGRRYSFRSKPVPFAPDHGFTTRARWTEIVAASVFGGDPELCPMLPPGLDNLRSMLDSIGDAGWTTSEGIVCPVSTRGFSKSWRLPTGLEVLSAVLSRHGLSAEVSGAGRIAREVVRFLGGTHGAKWLGNRTIIDRLDALSYATAEVEVRLHAEAAKRRRTRVGTIAREPLMALLRAANGDDEVRAQGHLAGLCQRRVLRVGLQVQCSHCQQRTWFGLDALGDRLTCERCLQEFSFPAWDPPDGRQEGWHYRPIGPFSIGGHAQGAYGVAFTLRFFANFLMHGRLAWIPPFEIMEGDRSLGEVDFGLVHVHHGLRETPRFIFGECKVGNGFGEKDLSALSRLADLVPDASIAISTLEPRLTKPSRENVLRLFPTLAAGDRPRRFDDRLIILTAHELFSTDRPPTSWRASSDERVKQMADTVRALVDVENLARASQELHLGVKPMAPERKGVRPTRASPLSEASP